MTSPGPSNAKVDSVPLFDLKAQYLAVKDEVDKAIADIFESQYFILGPEVKALEEEIAAYCGVKRAVGCSSGTDALLMSLMALGVRPGDEVIIPSFTFFATGGVVHRLFAKPVFVDVDPETYMMDPAKIEEAITEKTKAIIPVHLYGQCADMNPILAIADAKGIPVIEDNAQSIGAKCNGRFSGSMGRVGCISFYPTKNLAAPGEGGMITTNDEKLADLLTAMRDHGQAGRYHHEVVGGNFRLQAIPAAVLRRKFTKLDEWAAGRQRIAALYEKLFESKGLTGEKIVPPAVCRDNHVYSVYTIQAEDRDGLQKHLTERNVGTKVYYPVPLHMQECFSYLGYKPSDLPVSEAAANRVLGLPIYPQLTEAQVEYVGDAIAEYYG